MTHSNSNSHKGLTRRHHRVDADLQARARPFSLVRNDAAKKIRSFVENHADDQAQPLNRRLFSSTPVGGGGGGSGTSGGGTGTGGSSTGNGGSSGDPDPVEGPGAGSGGSNSGGSGTGGNSGGNNGGDNGSDTGNKTGANGSNSATKGNSNPKSSSTSSDNNIFSSIFHRPSTTSTSTSTTPSTTSSSSTTPSTTSAISTTSSTYSPSTSIAYVTPSSAAPTLNNAASSPSQSSSSDSSGPGAGLIIGIVAGALAGVAVLAALIGFLFKKFGKKEDPYETDPFDHDEFRRQSAMLPDTFDDIDNNPEMSEMHHGGGMGGYGDEMEYAGMGVAGAGAASAFTARNETGGPRPPTMFQKHMNAPAAQISVGDSPPVPVIGAIYNTNGMDPTPQLPPMAFGGSDPYSMAGVGRQNFDNNINNPYGYLDRQYSSNRSSPPQEKYVDAVQGYASLDRSGSNGSMNEKVHGMEDYSSYSQHNTSGRPGTAEGRSGTPDLPNLQQTYAIGENDNGRVQSPNRMVTSPEHMSQDYLTNGMHAQSMDQNNHYSQQYVESNSPQNKPLQVRNLLPNPHANMQQRDAHGRPVSGVSSVADDEAAYGGVW